MIVVASGNEHKIAEVSALPAAAGLELVGIKSLGPAPTVEEDGTTFEENAVIKAVKYSLWLKRELGISPPVVGEDAGLAVEALLGWPGILSARIANTNEERIQLVLSRLDDCSNRSAQFMAFTALAIGGELVHTWRGAVNGQLTRTPRGSAGFGYDPIFEVPSLGLTFAELSQQQKNEISHRGRAWSQALGYIRDNY